MARNPVRKGQSPALSRVPSQTGSFILKGNGDAGSMTTWFVEACCCRVRVRPRIGVALGGFLGQALGTKPGSLGRIGGATALFDRKNRCRALMCGAYFPLALVSRRLHNANVPQDSPFVVKVERDAQRQGRFRWHVFQNGIMREASVYSFATKYEAQVDADNFVEKLNATWRTVR
jgi:hypothetical protein